MRQPCLPLLALAVTLIGPSAHAIEDGFVAEPCAWPEVVRVFSGWGPVGDQDGLDTITCTGVYIGGRTVLTAAECVQLQPTPYEILFSDAFGTTPRSIDRMRVAIPVDECRQHPVVPIAACTLREVPTMQAVPIVAPCEVEELLVAGAELFVVGANAEKRWAEATLASDLSAASWDFELPDTIWATNVELSSEVLEVEDLGAPLYVQSPDGSLRVAAITFGVEPAQWLGTWALVDWLLDEESLEVVLPCHSLAGSWDPGPGCMSLIADRSSSAGSWGRGPAACSTEGVVTPTPTCSP